MMKSALLAIALIAGGLTAFGQQDAKQQKMTPEQRASHLTEKMVKQLELNADQAAKIAEINQGIAQKNENVRSATNMTAEQKKEVLESNRVARMSMYKNVMTAEQYAKCEAFEKERAARKEARQAERRSDRKKVESAPEEDPDDL